MTMAERLELIPEKRIVVKEAVPLAEGTLINGMIEAPLPYHEVQATQDIVETIGACVCHTIGEHQICVLPQGVDNPPMPGESDGGYIIPQFSVNNTLALGKLVNNPEVATTLMEEVVIENVSLLEKANIDRDYIDGHLNKMINHIDNISQRMRTPGESRTARSEAIQFIKRGELSATAVVSAIIFTANKISS